MRRVEASERKGEGQRGREREREGEREKGTKKATKNGREKQAQFTHSRKKDKMTAIH